MSFSGLALTYTFVQDSTKNVKSIFQFFLNLFIFGEKVNSRKKGKLIFFKVNHMLMWKTKNWLSNITLFCPKVLRSSVMNIERRS